MSFDQVKIPIHSRTNVLVVGGGPSGVAAAIAAARVGVQVTLIEKNGCLGGMATSGLVNPFMISKTNNNLLVRGVFEEIIDELKSQNACQEGELFGRPHITFDSEVLKIILDQMVLQENINLLLHVFVVGVITKNDNLCGVVIEGKSGQQRILADVIIDASGDADVANLSSATIEKGRQKDGLMQPATLCFSVGGIDMSKMPSRESINQEFINAKKDFPVKILRNKLLWFETKYSDEIHVNTTRILKVDGTKIDDLTKAEIEGRKQAQAILNFFKEKIAGFENAYIRKLAAEVGIRESRRVIGEYVLSKDDIVNCEKFNDAIAASNYPIDIHAPNDDGLEIIELRPNTYYEIPLRCLIPEKINGLVVVGRPISVTHEALASTRVMPTCMATGQAGGVLAALAVKNRLPIRKVNYQKVQEELLEQGVVMHES